MIILTLPLISSITLRYTLPCTIFTCIILYIVNLLYIPEKTANFEFQKSNTVEKKKSILFFVLKEYALLFKKLICYNNLTCNV